MILQRQPNRWSCLPTAFAIALEYPVDQLIQLIGHDGSEIIRPEQSEPMKRRGFHPQELVNVCFLNKHGVIVFEAYPSLSDGEKTTSIESKLPFTLGVMQHKIGVITGKSFNGRRHAVAWNGEKVYDPNGSIYSLNRFLIDSFYLIIAI